MELEHIEISSFRNLGEVQYKPQGLWVIFGPNGSGKSNLLEAISALASRSPFGPRGTDAPQGFARFIANVAEGSSGPDFMWLLDLVFGRREAISCIQRAFKQPGG